MKITLLALAALAPWIACDSVRAAALPVAPPLSEICEENLLESSRIRLEHHEQNHWLVFRQDGLALGDVILTPLSGGRLEVGLKIYYKGQGFGAEAEYLAFREAFARPGVTVIEAQIEAFHQASLRMHRKLGFEFRALRKGAHGREMAQLELTRAKFLELEARMAGRDPADYFQTLPKEPAGNPLFEMRRPQLARWLNPPQGWDLFRRTRDELARELKADPAMLEYAAAETVAMPESFGALLREARSDKLLAYALVFRVLRESGPSVETPGMLLTGLRSLEYRVIGAGLSAVSLRAWIKPIREKFEAEASEYRGLEYVLREPAN